MAQHCLTTHVDEVSSTAGPERSSAPLDCLIVGGGPAGLTAALYLARFGRRFIVVDAGGLRASWIPTSHNIPLFADGISGSDILARQRDHLARYGIRVTHGTVTGLARHRDSFVATIDKGDQTGLHDVRARRVLLAVGAADVEPNLPDLPDAVQRGLVRYCPICDGYEARGKRIAVIGQGDKGLGEAVFISRTYSRDVTLLTLGQGMELNENEHKRVEEHGIRVVHEPVVSIVIEEGRVTVLRTTDGTEHSFEVLYSALGLKLRSELALALGAAHDETGALTVDEHNRTTVPGLYAAGGVVRGLVQVVVAMGHGAIAATDIHNRCELPTEEESDGGLHLS
jgi:thioredoxin reductase (NADPH)